MQNDDLPIGRLLSRRDAILLFGLTGLSLAGCPAESALTNGTTGSNTSDTTDASDTSDATDTNGDSGMCVARPEATEGPYFVDEMLNRSDIREDPSDGSAQEGVLFNLEFRLRQISGASCVALADAQIDVWHANAAGEYSDESALGTRGHKYLRGYQLTDADGVARFETIYPGWYRGRATHIHFKIRLTSGGRDLEFTSQLFFDDNLTDVVYEQSPYNQRGARDTRNSRDGIYDSRLLLETVADGDGYRATFNIALDVD